MTALYADIAAGALCTPLGAQASEVAQNCFAGMRAAAVHPLLGSGGPRPLMATIAGEPPASRNARYLRRIGRYAMEVGKAAFVQSRVTAGPRTGLFSGVGGLRAHWEDMLGALLAQTDDGADAWERGLRGIHPYWMLRHLSNNAHALLSMELGLRGEGATFGGATGGAQAIAAATRALHAGAIDAALVFAYDSLLEPETLVELSVRRVLFEGALTDCAGPYDQHSRGFVPGEAAAALLLVRPGDAEHTLGRVAAFATGDGQASEPAPGTLTRALRNVADTRGNPCFVDAAGRGECDADASERQAIAEVLHDQTPLTSIAAATGHMGAATSLVQTLVLTHILRSGQLPAVAGLRDVAPGPLCPLREATPHTMTAAYGISLGAPGLAAAIQVKLP